MAEHAWEEVIASTTISSSADNPRTPSTTTMSESMPLRDKDKDEHASAVLTIENLPIPGKSLMIRTRKEPHLILTLCSGELKFLRKPIPGGGCFWQCVKKDGWLGFRNTVSGTYLGHDGQGKLYAKQSHHEPFEHFTMERDVDGGYILQQLMGPNNELVQVCLNEDGKSLMQQKEGGTAWDFIDVQYVCYSVALTYPNMEPERLR